jgi:hypothetical protein
MGIALLAAVCAAATAPAGASAQGPEFVPLGQGSFPSLDSTWQALAIRSDTIFFDLYDDEGSLYYTYAPKFDKPPPKRLVAAISYRPFGLPTVATFVGGVAGKRVKTVKVFFDGAPTQKLRTTKAPREWGFAARFFGTGGQRRPELRQQGSGGHSDQGARRQGQAPLEAHRRAHEPGLTVSSGSPTGRCRPGP